jgi:hypothetical protein
MIEFIDNLFTIVGTTDNYNVIVDLHTFLLTVTHAHVSQSFLAISWQHSHWNFKSHIKSYFHSLIPFLLYSATANSEDSTQFNSSAPKLISWQAGVSKLDSILLNWTLLYKYFARTKQKTQSLYCYKGVFAASLYSNGSYPIVACVFVASEMFTDLLPSNEHLFWIHYSGFRVSYHLLKPNVEIEY